MVEPLLGEHRLNLIPQLLFDYCCMLARIGVTFVRDLTPIDTILQHQIEGPAGKLSDHQRECRLLMSAACSEFPPHQVLPEARALIGALNIAGTVLFEDVAAVEVTVVVEVVVD